MFAASLAYWVAWPWGYSHEQYVATLLVRVMGAVCILKMTHQRAVPFPYYLKTPLEKPTGMY